VFAITKLGFFVWLVFNATSTQIGQPIPDFRVSCSLIDWCLNVCINSRGSKPAKVNKDGQRDTMYLVDINVSYLMLHNYNITKLRRQLLEHLACTVFNGSTQLELLVAIHYLPPLSTLDETCYGRLVMKKQHEQISIT